MREHTLKTDLTNVMFVTKNFLTQAHQLDTKEHILETDLTNVIFRGGKSIGTWEPSSQKFFLV